jgi:tRNA-uridine 2-sulfurtransferase
MVAMSGGVDSSVAAALLVAEGHDVTGVTMKLWGGASDTGCCSATDVDDARRVAQQLGIPHFVFNLSDDFERHVVDPYLSDHAHGRTPNPCIECNRHLKFDVLLARAGQLGFDVLATGHHAIVTVDRSGTRRVARGADRAKDQSYVLYMLGSSDLARCRFPVGHMDKAAVRDMAARLCLRSAAKPDSQDVCFITRGGRASFLADHIPLTPGRVVDRSGTLLGSVDAVELVTVGQRKGLRLGGASQRRYALDVDVATATVTAGDAKELAVTHQPLVELHWSAADRPGLVLAQVSAHGPALPAVVEAGPSMRWLQPAARVAPGQAVVLYDQDDRVVLGGGLAARAAGQA